MVISPEKLLGNNPQEHDHQVAFFQWVAVSGSKRYPDMLMAHAVPNGAKLMGVGTPEGRREGNRMKAEGLRPGVPDVFVPVPNLQRVKESNWHIPPWYGLWLELKKPGREKEKNGGRSDDQVKWQKKLLAQGYAVVTAYGWTGAAHAIALYFGGTMAMPENGDCFFSLATPDAPW